MNINPGLRSFQKKFAAGITDLTTETEEGAILLNHAGLARNSQIGSGSPRQVRRGASYR